MNIRSLRTLLAGHPQKEVRLRLPNGAFVPSEFHLTEVAHITKRFIDCGGIVRTQQSCLLQAWVAENDPDHRLTAGKISGILDAAGGVVPDDELPVEIEYDSGVVGQYTVEGGRPEDGNLVIRLAHKNTDCLAREVCGAAPASSPGCGCGSGEGECC